MPYKPTAADYAYLLKYKPEVFFPTTAMPKVSWIVSLIALMVKTKHESTH